MPSDAEKPRAELTVVGVTNRTATAAVRERLFIEGWQQPSLLAALRHRGIEEALVLSTCERTEVIASLDSDAGIEAITVALARLSETERSVLAGQSRVLRGEAALRHLFAVASSLESQVIGEPQVLGQLKECHRHAAAQGMTGPILEDALGAAYAAAKRVRSETAIGERPVSLAASAIQLAGDLHGPLAPLSALLLGLGEMSEPLALAFKDAGLGRLTVTHPSPARAESVARRLDGHFQAWDSLGESIAAADIIIAAEGSGRYAVSPSLAEAALKRRRRRPIFFIDAALPADVDPAVERLDGAFVYDLHDLEHVAQQGTATRRQEAESAWAILEEELAGFKRRQAGRRAAPTLTALRRHFEARRGEVLRDSSLDAAAATRLLINRLLHEPSEVLRQAAADARDQGRALEASSKRLFGLNEGKGQDGEPEEDSR